MIVEDGEVEHNEKHGVNNNDEKKEVRKKPKRRIPRKEYKAAWRKPGSLAKRNEILIVGEVER